MYSFIKTYICSKNIKKGKAMETKEEVIKKLDEKIEAQKDTMIDNICNIQQIINEMDKALNILCYLSFIKREFIKKDEG